MSGTEKTQLDSESYEDFLAARNRAFLDSVTALLARRSPSLVPFALVRKYLGSGGESYLGLQAVRVEAIVGSEQRSEDFTRHFAPKASIARNRWMSLAAANRAGYGLPPVVLYELGGVYFVRDGNHRVSVARSLGLEYIDAEVVGLGAETRLSPSMDAKALLRLMARSMALRFAAETGLPLGRAGLRADSPWVWDALLVDIERHRLFLGGALGFKEAAQSWYATLYLPIVGAARRARLLRRGSATEFYLLAASWEAEYEETSSSCLDSDDATRRYAASRPGLASLVATRFARWLRTLQTMLGRVQR